jgi:choline dehydrogenase-like flavoprotein
METPRVLLHSNDVQTEGLGNSNDMVGRYFMMHPHGDIGTVVYDSPEFIPQLIRQKEGDVEIISIVGLTEKTQISEQLLSSSIQIVPIPDPDSGHAAAKRITKDLKKLEWPDDFGEDLWQVLSDLDSVATGTTGNVGPSGSARMWVQSEQAPNPDSRIILDEEIDALGMRKLAVDCRLQEIDHQTIKRLGQLYGNEVARLGLGRVKLTDWVDSDSMVWPEELESGCHHLGGARMSTNPTEGVVDTNLRVHGIDNLYIASSAVFPTGSDVNPTISIVALSLRLTEHLRKVLA